MSSKSGRVPETFSISSGSGLTDQEYRKVRYLLSLFLIKSSLKGQFFFGNMPGFTVHAVFFFLAPLGKFHSVVNLKMHLSVRGKRVSAVLNGNVQHYSVTLEQKVVFKKILMEQHWKSIVTFFFNEGFVMKAKCFNGLLM